MNDKVDAFIGRAKNWQEEMEELRAILLDCRLTEDIKWGKPCYGFEGKNIVIIQSFKDYCALLFFKGALLKDHKGILVKTGPNTQVGRQARFTSVKEVVKLKKVMMDYVFQAVEVEESGVKVEIKKHLTPMPAELKSELDKKPALKKAFNALTPGRQRSHIFHIAGAKQSKTREARIEKCIPQIMEGKGFNEYQTDK